MSTSAVPAAGSDERRPGHGQPPLPVAPTANPIIARIGNTAEKFWRKHHHVLTTAKVLLVMMAPSGTGKDTFLLALAPLLQMRIEDVWKNTCSADDAFWHDGVYTHDHMRVYDAHNECRERLDALMAAGRRLVVSNNTNIPTARAPRALDSLVALAGKHHYKMLIISLEDIRPELADAVATLRSSPDDPDARAALVEAIGASNAARSDKVIPPGVIETQIDAYIDFLASHAVLAGEMTDTVPDTV